jgi:hypothetical protein
MGMEELTSIGRSNIATLSSMTNDHSNPQQGTGTIKAVTQSKEEAAGDQECSEVGVKPPSPPSSNCVEDKRKLFVGGLPTDITDPEFRDFFSQFGELKESLVMFDTETRRSRGFGFVTYVDPDVSKSVLQMGNHGDGIGRLVMRGKTCEVKAAAPKGHAPTRGGKSNRANRGGSRNQHHMHPFVNPGHFPAMYQNDGYNLPFHHEVYMAASNGYSTRIYHPALPTYGQPQSHGSPVFNGERDPKAVGLAGAPYFFAPPIAMPHAEHFSTGNEIPSHQFPAYFQQHGYAFIPVVSGPIHAQSPFMEDAHVTRTTEASVQAMETMNNAGEAVL